MQRSHIIYFIILLFIAIVAILGFFSKGSFKVVPTTATSTVITALTTRTTTINQTSNNSTTSTVIPVGSCLSPAQKVSLKNGNFSTGNYSGWSTDGAGFGSAPLNLTKANMEGAYFNHTWIGYDGTFFATTFEGGINVQPGNLSSNKFYVVEPYLNFKIISPQNNNLYVQILSSSNTPLITTHYNTYAALGNVYASSQFVNASIALSTFLCQNVTIRVVATVVGGAINRQQYIAVGDFYLSKVPVQTSGIIAN